MLAALVGGSVVGIGGCTGRSEGVEVVGVEVINLAWTPRTVDVELRAGGETVWTETEAVGVDSERPLECTWPRAPGEYTITARLANGDGRAERTLADAGGTDGGGRVAAFVVVGLRASVSIETTDDYTRPPGFSGTCE